MRRFRRDEYRRNLRNLRIVVGGLAATGRGFAAPFHFFFLGEQAPDGADGPTSCHFETRGRTNLHGDVQHHVHVVLVRVTTAVRPTEEPDRVREAVVRFFPDADVNVTQDSVLATTHDLLPLRRRVWELRIIDTFRGQVLHGATEQGKGRSARFRLSKQAAFAGKLSFAPTPHPLGDLDVRIELERGDPWADIERLAFWLCPETKDGEIVGATD